MQAKAVVKMPPQSQEIARQHPSTDTSIESNFNSATDMDLSNFYANSPLSIDGMLLNLMKFSFPQIISMISFKFTVIINAFFLSLAGYYRIETHENTTNIIKGLGLGNMILNILCFAIS